MDVHAKFIHHIDFIPEVFTYDNMRTVVKSRESYHGQYDPFIQYYPFKIRLCEPRKGNEKGLVERSVEFIRRKAFSTAYSFASLQEAEEHLSSTLQKLNERYHHEHKVKHITLMEDERKVTKQAVLAPFDGAELNVS